MDTLSRRSFIQAAAGAAALGLASPFDSLTLAQGRRGVAAQRDAGTRMK